MRGQLGDHDGYIFFENALILQDRRDWRLFVMRMDEEADVINDVVAKRQPDDEIRERTRHRLMTRLGH